METTTATGLVIPANIWQGCTVREFARTVDGDVELDPVRAAIGAEWIEAIYPHELPSYWPQEWGSPLFYGDENARLVPEPRANSRATALFGFPYLIVGDVVLFIDAGNGVTGGVAPAMLEHLGLTAPTVLAPFPEDGCCTHCHGVELRLAEGGYVRTWDLRRDDDPEPIWWADFHGLEDFTDDGDGDYWAECANCLARYAAPAEWEWN